MGQCANTIPWIVNYALTAFSLIILSINLKLKIAKLLQKSEMRKDIVIELSYKGFG